MATSFEIGLLLMWCKSCFGHSLSVTTKKGVRISAYTKQISTPLRRSNQTYIVGSRGVSMLVLWALGGVALQWVHTGVQVHLAEELKNCMMSMNYNSCKIE